MRSPGDLFSTEIRCTTTPGDEHHQSIRNTGDVSSLRRYWGLRVLRLCDGEVSITRQYTCIWFVTTLMSGEKQRFERIDGSMPSIDEAVGIDLRQRERGVAA